MTHEAGMGAFVALAVAAACSGASGGGSDAGFDAGEDGGRPERPDAMPGRAWGVPVAVPGVNSSAEDAQPAMTADRLMICFTSGRSPGGAGAADIWCARRGSDDAAFDPPANQDLINTASDDWMPDLSPDGMTIYFASGRDGSHDIFRASWNGTEFAGVAEVTEVNTGSSETGPSISADGRTLLFDSDRDAAAGTNDVYRATRSSAGSTPFGTPDPLSINTVDDLEGEPGLSGDASFLAFCSDRGMADGTFFLFGASAVGDDFGAAAPLDIDQPAGLTACGPAIASDGSLLFHSSRPGGEGAGDLYLAPAR